jgi:hypothetical protein
MQIFPACLTGGLRFVESNIGGDKYLLIYGMQISIWRNHAPFAAILSPQALVCLFIYSFDYSFSERIFYKRKWDYLHTYL